MSIHNHRDLICYSRISDEVRFALMVLDIEFYGYRSEYWAYQFHDRKSGRNYHVDEEDMTDATIRTMIDDITARRRGETPATRDFWS